MRALMTWNFLLGVLWGFVVGLCQFIVLIWGIDDFIIAMHVGHATTKQNVIFAVAFLSAIYIVKDINRGRK